jgi:hypothetical protein
MNRTKLLCDMTLPELRAERERILRELKTASVSRWDKLYERGKWVSKRIDEWEAETWSATNRSSE